MANRTQTRGNCIYCGKEMTRGGLARHLASCAKRQEAIAAADIQHGRNQTLYHLQVQDAWGGAYWLHLEMRGAATLEDLDFYLREIWLECCGHLSAFEIGGVHYTQLLRDGMGFEIEKSMKIQVQRIFAPGMQIPYEYDFGTTSELVIKVVGERHGKATTENPIVLMARNKFQPPPCTECGQPANWVCVNACGRTIPPRCSVKSMPTTTSMMTCCYPLSTLPAPACAATPAWLSRRTRLRMLPQELQA